MKIQVPVQVIARENTGSSEKLENALSLLGHHNETSRQDAVHQIKELFAKDKQIYIDSVGLVTTAVARAAFDSNDGVSKGIHDFANQFFEMVPETEMAPFFPVLVAYTGSGMSHINERIRLRALRFLRLLYTHYEALVSRFGGPLLEQFFQQLRTSKPTVKGGAGRSFSFAANSQMGLFNSRHEILDILYVFCSLLWRGKSRTEFAEAVSFWKCQDCVLGRLAWERVSFSAPIAREAAVHVSSSKTLLVNPELADLDSKSLQSSEILLSGPEVVSSPHLSICHSVVSLLHLLWPEKALRDASLQEADRLTTLLLQHIYSVFPFSKGQSCRDSRTWQGITKMNLLFASTLLDLAKRSADKEQRQEILQNVQAFAVDMIRALCKTAASFELDSFATDFINDLSLELPKHDNHALLEVLVEYQVRAKSTDTAFRVFEMIARLSPGQEGSPLLAKWILGLPKQLWQLKAKALPFSKAILVFLKGVFQVLSNANDKVSLWTLNRQVFFDSMQQALVPLFVSYHTGRAIYGPLASYPEELQALALSLAYYIPAWTMDLAKAMTTWCHSASWSTTSLLLDIGSARQDSQTPAMVSEAWISLRFSIAMGQSSYHLAKLRETRRSELARLVIDHTDSADKIISYQSSRSLCKSMPAAVLPQLYSLMEQGLTPLMFCSCIRILSGHRLAELPTLVYDAILDAGSVALEVRSVG
ncbi:Testis-expressed sequence 10 protein [Kappamyces sp. JEL0829]|nr:Testis-expressed sequence 10 protein [Kappamyces sp. JEL0829]